MFFDTVAIGFLELMSVWRVDKMVMSFLAAVEHNPESTSPIGDVVTKLFPGAIAEYSSQHS